MKVKNISKVYGKGDNAFTALSNISLDIQPGETVAIVGKSGSGKSTLMHILTGLDTPTKGDVFSDGKSIFSQDTDDWRGNNIGIVFQQFFLQSNISVLQNVILPLKIMGYSRKQRVAMAEETIHQVGLEDKINTTAGDLSGGQKQRVAIARALVTKPKILVADEPTGNLDSENGKIVADLLFSLNKQLKTTLMIVTHDEDLAKRCQRIVRLKDGEVITENLKGKQKK